MTREDVFIANILKSRPPGNRDPQPEEIEACWPYLERQIQLIEPRVIATLGNFATKKITGSQTGITRVSGTPQVHELGGRTVFVLPALASGGGAAHALGGGDAARGLREAAAAARRAAARARGSDERPRTPRTRPRGRAESQLDLFA